MAVEFSEIEITSEDHRWRALVVAATVPVILDREKLLALRQDTAAGPIDRMILQKVRTSDRFDLIIFRGRSEGTGCWTFSPDLTPAEQDELGYLLTKSQVQTYRRFLAAGLLAIIHVEFDTNVIDAFRSGTDRLLGELELSLNGGTAPSRIAAADRWSLRHLTFYFGLSFERAVQSALPGRLRLLGPGVARMRELVESLPPAAID